MNKKIKIVFVLLFLVTLGFIINSFLRKKEKPDTSSKEKLVLLNTNPSVGTNVSWINPTLGIIFNFDTPLNVSTAFVTITPYTPFRVERSASNPNSLIVRPLEYWNYQTVYTITIKKGLLSEDERKELDFDYNYTLKLNEPPSDIIQMPPPI